MMRARAKRKARPTHLLEVWRAVSRNPVLADICFRQMLASIVPGRVLSPEQRAVMREIAAKGQGP